ncbi:Polyketide cyclase / dehydrase and lipid transport [metagenome]|uniref:Polyketide cyclase / dehydrase and lipid transport n=1 Tax=metagenome TaxID=256318 RepID=A0A2P2CE93_9ZZZZ
MRMLTVSRDLDAPADAVWSLLVDPTAWPDWGPTVAGVELATRSVEPGSRGRVRTVVGVWLPFEITGWEPGRSWSWRIAGVPATTHTVRPTSAGGCAVTFGVPWWAPAYLPVCALALRRLEALC